ncbi:MAG TPA: LptA/OstA family protein [Oligoflexia bacterium]|nr:LptA/OstA family protein [Oligoflexia bacterium]
MITIKVPEVLLGSLFSLIIVFSVNSSMAFAQTGDVSSKVEKSNDSGSGLKKALGGGGDSKGPVFIKSDSLMLDSKDRLFTYKGNVRVVRDDLEITTDIMIGRYGENQELESILCQSNVVITRGESMRATSNRAFYNLKSAKIARDGNLLAADKITIFVDEDRSEAEGNVRVKVIKADETGSGGERMRGIVKKQPVTESE